MISTGRQIHEGREPIGISRTSPVTLRRILRQAQRDILRRARGYSDVMSTRLCPTTISGAMMVQHDDLSALIDHTILRPDATPDDIHRHCQQAVNHGFKAVCVNSVFIPQVVAQLVGSSVLACSVVGFPLGAVPTAIKAAEIEMVLSWGASEIDMVISIGGLKAGHALSVTEEVATLKRICGGACLKVILETSLLTDAEIVAGCHAVHDAGADFVKTSTGFAGKGATVEHVTLMRRTVGLGMGVKASGGISTRGAAEAMVKAGANRIGASQSVQIVRGGV